MGLYTPPIKPDWLYTRASSDDLSVDSYIKDCKKPIQAQSPRYQCQGCGSYGERHTCEYCGTVLNVHLREEQSICNEVKDKHRRFCKEEYNILRSVIVKTSSGGAR